MSTDDQFTLPPIPGLNLPNNPPNSAPIQGGAGGTGSGSPGYTLSGNLPIRRPSPYPSLDEVAIPIITPIEPGPVDLIPGLLPRRGELVIAGETNIGKSLMALEICSSLVTGRPLWGELVPTGRAEKILYVLGEHYIGIIQGLWNKTGLPLTPGVLIVGPDKLGSDKWLVNNGRPNSYAISKFQRWAEGVDLIIFDPLASFITGKEGTENDNLQMRLVLDSMSLIAQSSGASCLVIAHQGKPSMGKYGEEMKRTKYAIRGASGIEDAATNIFYLGEAQGESEAAKRAAEGRLIELTCRKYKGEAPDRYRLLRDPNTLQHTLLGNRPFAEVQKIDTQASYARFALAFPSASQADVMKMVATSKNVSERTIYRHLGQTEPVEGIKVDGQSIGLTSL